jgi:hypothetical protein
MSVRIVLNFIPIDPRKGYNRRGLIAPRLLGKSYKGGKKFQGGLSWAADDGAQSGLP